MKNLFLTDTSIPKGYEYLLEETLPTSAIVYSVIGMVLIFAAMVAMVILVRNKEKGSIVCMIAGVSFFIIFDFLLVMVAGIFISSLNFGAYLVLSSLIASVIPLVGRVLFTILLSRKYDTMKDQFGYGIGIMGVKAVASIFTLFVPVMNYIQIENLGVGYFFPPELTEEIANEQAESLIEMLEFDYRQCILMMLISVSVMVSYVAFSVPIYAACNGGKSKGWYGFALGGYFLLAVCECLFNNDVFNIPAVFIAVAIACGIVFIAVKLYKELKPDEEKKENKKTEESISKNARTKIPKFKDLDKL